MLVWVDHGVRAVSLQVGLTSHSRSGEKRALGTRSAPGYASRSSLARVHL